MRLAYHLGARLKGLRKPKMVFDIDLLPLMKTIPQLCFFMNNRGGGMPKTVVRPSDIQIAGPTIAPAPAPAPTPVPAPAPVEQVFSFLFL